MVVGCEVEVWVVVVIAATAKCWLRLLIGTLAPGGASRGALCIAISAPAKVPMAD